MTRSQPERNRALVFRREGNIIYLDLYDWYPVPVKLEVKPRMTIVSVLKWFRRRTLPDRLRSAGL